MTSKPQFVYTTFIRSTPERVWDAIVRPEFTRQYWGGMTNVSDWSNGSLWQHLNPENETWVQGQVVESVPPSRLVLTWADPDDLQDVSRVAFEIEAKGDMVCLKVIHDHFRDDSTMADKVSKGWPLVLSSLKSFLETGNGLDILCQSGS